MRSVGLHGFALGIALAAPVSAHHSMGSYDQTALVTIKGTVTQVEWRNPHTWITLTVRNADGTTAIQRIEIAGPNGLMKKGVTKGLVNVGDSVAFEAWMPKDPRFGNTPNGRTMLRDGRRFDVGDNWGEPPITRARER
jgi:uncharacterized protein DUF6152